jgi:hypothetical protein
MDIENLSSCGSGRNPWLISAKSIREHDLLEWMRPQKHNELLENLARSNGMDVENSGSRKNQIHSPQMLSESGSSSQPQDHHE